MKLFTWIILSCYSVAFVLLGAGLIAFSLHGISIDRTVLWLEAAYTEKDFRIACFLVGAGVILLNWTYAEMTISRFRKQKTIAFENADGQVTVSLSAIDDFIRKAAVQQIAELKELRSDVVARNGKIIIRARATLWSEANIPMAAEKIQTLVKSKVQEVLAGIDEPIFVRVHVAKIVQRENRSGGADRRPVPFAPPFRGF